MTSFYCLPGENASVVAFRPKWVISPRTWNPPPLVELIGLKVSAIEGPSLLSGVLHCRCRGLEGHFARRRTIEARGPFQSPAYSYSSKERGRYRQSGKYTVIY